ncbi:MAG: acyltransferase family protein [Alphaproteobacteria bacterium]|nr:acyltransferase family protein [Alphaproteobacteria bacterium]
MQVQGPDGEPPRGYATIRRVLEPLRAYHHHEVDGPEHVPAEGPAICVVNHSLATYDALLLGLAIHDATGRVPLALGDDLLFKLPGLAGAAWTLGVRPASHAHGVRGLADGRLVFVAPGGMREALRPSRERGEVRWGRRQGFVRLALRTGAPLVLAACPDADDIYTVVDNPVTGLAYKALKVPVPLAYGLGPTLVPRPVRLRHRVAAPLRPPAWEPEREEEQVADLHADVLATMARLMERPPGSRRGRGPRPR